MIKISVIIPVYNVEPYLRDCLDSIINQSLEKIELICINDGSTDGSLSILEEYAQKDSRIKLVSQENQGQGVARNKAIKLAQGEYIFFVDPDDWIENGALQNLYEFAKSNGSNIVHFNHYAYEELTKRVRPISFNKKIKKMYGYDLVEIPHYSWRNFKAGCLTELDTHAWTHFYKTEFIRNNNICFGSGRRGEDHLFTLGALLIAAKVDFLNQYLYYYRARQNSATHSKGSDNFVIFENFEALKQLLKSLGLLEELSDEFYKYMVTVMYWHYNQTPTNLIKDYEKMCADRISDDDCRRLIKKAKYNMVRMAIICFIKNLIYQKIGLRYLLTRRLVKSK